MSWGGDHRYHNNLLRIGDGTGQQDKRIDGKGKGEWP
jgi:hypothetical protein